MRSKDDRTVGRSSSHDDFLIFDFKKCQIEFMTVISNFSNFGTKSTPLERRGGQIPKCGLTTYYGLELHILICSSCQSASINQLYVRNTDIRRLVEFAFES